MNPLQELYARVHRAESEAAVWRGLCGVLCLGIVTLGVLLSIVGREHQAVVNQRVQQTLALPR